MAGAILKDAGTEPGALALVEFALEELYERSGGKQLTVAAYRAQQGGDGGEVGGIGGVIEGQAEKAVQDAAGKVDEGRLNLGREGRRELRPARDPRRLLVRLTVGRSLGQP
ncbi:MAG: hypothetical protein H0T87_09850 [Gammaproteobacteria bacterium]|nr:hypothetical protein [Gammaproteobacteria bacterium]